MSIKRIVGFIMAVLMLTAFLSLVSCSGNKGGNMTEESGISKSGQNNVVRDEEAVKLTRGYYDWITVQAFDGFPEAILKTKLPKVLEDAVSSLEGDKKISPLSNVFYPTELSAAILTAYEYEIRKSSYTHNVTTVARTGEGEYKMRIKFNVDSKLTERIYTLLISSDARKVCLINYDENGAEKYFHEIVVTNDGYVAINRSGITTDKWTSIQLIFKGSENAEGYCAYVEGQAEKPVSIYKDSVYSGFAGKN